MISSMRCQWRYDIPVQYAYDMLWFVFDGHVIRSWWIVHLMHLALFVMLSSQVLEIYFQTLPLSVKQSVITWINRAPLKHKQTSKTFIRVNHCWGPLYPAISPMRFIFYIWHVFPCKEAIRTFCFPRDKHIVLMSSKLWLLFICLVKCHNCYDDAKQIE